MSKSRFLSFLNCCFHTRVNDEEDDEKAIQEEKEEVERIITKRDQGKQNDQRRETFSIGKSPDEVLLKRNPMVEVSKQLIQSELIREEEKGKIDFVTLLTIRQLTDC